MSAPNVRLGLIVVLTSIPIVGVPAQGTAERSVAHGGAIHSLGGAGNNGGSSDKKPVIVIPPLNEGPSGTSGVPLGTTVGRRIR